MTDPTLKYFGAVIPLGNTSEILDSKAWQVFLNFCKSLGLTNFGNISYYAVVQAWADGVEPPATVPPFTIPPITPLPDPDPVPWYTTLKIGTHLKILRPLGLMVYLDSRLTIAWKRGRLPIGDTSMKLATPYAPDLDMIPPVGVLAVLLPSPPDFPAGLWIAAMGNDNMPNVVAV